MDKRGLWVDDPVFGTKIRLGEVGYEIASDMTLQGNHQAAREALRRLHVGLYVERRF